MSRFISRNNSPLFSLAVRFSFAGRLTRRAKVPFHECSFSRFFESVEILADRQRSREIHEALSALTGWRTRAAFSRSVDSLSFNRSIVTRRDFQNVHAPVASDIVGLLEWITLTPMITLTMKGDQEINWTRVVQTCRETSPRTEVLSRAACSSRFSFNYTFRAFLFPPSSFSQLVINVYAWASGFQFKILHAVYLICAQMNLHFNPDVFPLRVYSNTYAWSRI